MIILLLTPRRPTLTFDDIYTLQAVANQSVLSLASLTGFEPEQKTALAHEMVHSILEDLDLTFPDSLIETAVGAATFSLQIRLKESRS